MQYQIDNDQFCDQDQRDTDHEFCFTCFMTDQQHGQIHRRRAAERRDQQQRILFYAPISLLSGVFIMDRYKNGDGIDDDQINYQIFQNNLGVIQCSIKE